MKIHRTRSLEDGITFYLAKESGSIGEARASADYWRNRKFLARVITVFHKNTGRTYEVWVSTVRRRRK